MVRPIRGRRELAEGLVFGYVPQRESLDSGYPVSTLEVVEMGANRRTGFLRRLAPEERASATRLLEHVGLGAERSTPFAQLSGGQRQRALLARALMRRPNVLLLDEPTSGVDPKAQADILQLLRGLRSEGLAILLVTHQLGMVHEEMREVLLVKEGRVERGAPRDLLAPESVDPFRAVSGHA